MSLPDNLRYSDSHEWVKEDGGTVTMGITAFAVEQLTEPTFLELKKAGLSVKRGDELGIIESTKSTSPIYAPVDGEVVEVNDNAFAHLSLDNLDPYVGGWLCKIKLAAGASLDHLMTPAQYEAQIAGH